MNDVLLVVVVLVALGFDFTNGFHDTANAVATSVSTRALSPRLAVLIAAIANLAGAFVTTAVAKTVGKGIIDTGLANEKTVLAALIGAIVWNLITWRAGLPSSSSHALIGGLVGAAIAQSGLEGVQWHGLVHSVAIPAIAAPAIAFAGAFLLLLAIYWLLVWMNPGMANRTFRLGQLASGTWVAFTHGANDAQKTMGVIALALFEAGHLSHFYIPNWVIVSAGLAIAAGTYVGGWRIMKTLGQRVVNMEPASGFAAQITAGVTIYSATKLGYPLSTTHVISGSVLGSGATKRLSAVRWGVAGNIVTAWLLTIPAAGLVAAALVLADPGDLLAAALHFGHAAGPQRRVHDRAALRHPLRRARLRAEPDGARGQRDQRPRPGHRHLLGRPDHVRLQARVRDGEGLPRPARVRRVRGHPREPRLAQRRLRPLRGHVRRAQLGAAPRRRDRRGRRLDRARPRPRPDRPRALPLDRGAVRRRRRPEDLRPPPPPAAGARHGPRAQRRLRRRRLHRVPAARGRRPRSLGPQARAVCVAAREPVRRQRRHGLLDSACEARRGPVTT